MVTTHSTQACPFQSASAWAHIHAQIDLMTRYNCVYYSDGVRICGASVRVCNKLPPLSPSLYFIYSHIRVTVPHKAAAAVSYACGASRLVVINVAVIMHHFDVLIFFLRAALPSRACVMVTGACHRCRGIAFERGFTIIVYRSAPCRVCWFVAK